MKSADNELLCRVGPGAPMGELFRRFWLPALLPAQVEGPDCPPVRLRLLGENLIAFRDSEGRLGVVQEACPHRGASLYFGRNEDCGIRCVYHGWKFDVTGACVDIPNARAGDDIKERIRLTAYAAAEHGGFIWVYMGPAELRPPPPELEFAMLPASHRFQARWEYEANYLQGMEGEIDPSHTSFLHKFFDASLMTEGVQKAHDLWQLDSSPEIHVEQTGYGMYYGSRRIKDAASSYWRVVQWLAPIFPLIPSPNGQISSRVYVPVDDHNTLVMATRYHPERPLTEAERDELADGYAPDLQPGTFKPLTHRGNDYMLDREAQRTRSYTGIPGVNNQDRAIVESMGPIVDRTQEHLISSDRCIVTARRMLMRMALDLQAGHEPSLPSRPRDFGVRPVDMTVPEGEFGSLIDTYRDKLKLPEVA